MLLTRPDWVTRCNTFVTFCEDGETKREEFLPSNIAHREEVERKTGEEMNTEIIFDGNFEPFGFSSFLS